jgi:hypothetical protein
MASSSITPRPISLGPGTLADQPPQGNNAKCGFASHTVVAKKDYVFTAYGKR